MKTKLILSCCLFAFLLSACNDQEKVDELTSRNIELAEKTAEKEEQINQMLASFNTIQANLRDIKAREGIINVNTNEVNASDVGADINEDIEVISKLMQENERLIEDLNKQVKSSNIELTEFRKLINGLNRRVDDKNKEISDLNTKLQEKKILIGQLYFKNDSLRFTNQMKEAKLQEQIEEMNVGYFAYGTFKELKEKNVLTKEGGFLGIGKNQELKDDFNQDYFSKIDIRKQTSFLIYADEAKLITTHPKSSYEFMGSDDKVDSLVIKDKDAFWKASRYLVIVID